MDNPETIGAVGDPALGGLAAGLDLLLRGGPAMAAIAALSVLTLALILWKLMRLSSTGAWRRKRAESAVTAWQQGRFEDALQLVHGARGSCAKVVVATLIARADGRISEEDARAEAARVAKRELAAAQGGLRGLELVATVAPLLGLLGTVLGMIAAFQALEQAGAQADPSALAGGVWEALLTTAAGMAVAIPASAALTWFESVIDSLRRDMEDMATRIFTTPAVRLAQAAE